LGFDLGRQGRRKSVQEKASQRGKVIDIPHAVVKLSGRQATNGFLQALPHQEAEPPQWIRSAMVYTLTLFLALFFATLTLMLGGGLLGTLLSLRMSYEGFADLLIGVVMSGFYLGLIIGSFICPTIVRRAGHIRAFAVFAAINTAAALFYPLLISAPFWFFCRILTGIAMMGLYMVVESWLNDRTEPHMRGRVFSVYMAMTFLGLGFGQLLLNLGEVAGSNLFLVAGIFLVLCLVPVAMTRAISPELPEMAAINIRRMLRKAPLGLLGSLTAGMIASAFYSLAPVFAVKSGLEPHMVANFMGITILSGFCLQWPVGNLSDRFDRLRVLAGLALLVSFAAALVTLVADRSLALLLLAAAGFGGLTFTLYPVAVAHSNDRVESGEIMSASTVLILSYGIGACLGPLGGSFAMGLIGPSGLYLFIAVVAWLLGVGVIVISRREKPKPEEAFPYVPVPRTSPVISAIHPYAEEETAANQDQPADPERAGS